MSILEDTAAQAPEAGHQAGGNGKPSASTNGSGMRSRLLVDRYLTDFGIRFTVKTDANRTIYKVPCPFDQSHGSNGESAVVQRADGMVCFECKHKSCQGLKWQDYKAKIGTPDPQKHYDPPLANQHGNTQADPETPPEPPRFATTLLTSAEFDAMAYKQSFWIDHVLEAGSPCVGGGRSKTLKTSTIGVDMAVSLGSGTPFLGFFTTKQCRVAFWSGEAGAPTIQAKARQVAAARGVTLPECSVFWSFSLPKLGRGDHVAALRELIQKHKLDVAIVDPLYLSLLEAGDTGKPSDLFFMGSKLLPLSELGQETGCTIVLLHHFRKSGNVDGEEVALEELSQSGVAEWARQWVLLARRSPYLHDGKHELWMRCGGSSGHAGLYGVDIDEGTIDEHFDGRKWEVEVTAGHEIIQTSRKDRSQAKAEQQRMEDEAAQRQIIDAMSTRLARGEGVFISRLRDFTGIGEKRLSRLLVMLTDQGITEECQALRSPTHKTPQKGAFRLAESWWAND